MRDGCSILFAGQSLIKRDVRTDASAGFAAVKRVIGAADHAFTNFEGSISGPHGGEVTKDSYYSVVDPSTLEGLRGIGFDLLSLCNNHAFDFGPGGILSTVDAVTELGFAWAGAGGDLDEASRPGFLETPERTIALVGVDCGPQPDRVYARNADGAEEAHPGINPQRFVGEGDVKTPDAADWERNGATVAQAREKADLVIAYVHSHHWEPKMWQTPSAMIGLAHALVDAGADVVVGHGTPATQGLELYNGRPIFYGLGNFIFHSWNPARWYGEAGMRSWQSVLATCRWDAAAELQAIEIVPVCLGHKGEKEGVDDLGDVPLRATGKYGATILQTFRDLSGTFDTAITVGDGVGRVVIP